MDVDSRCVMFVVCNRLTEDGAHLFFKCKFVRHVWEAVGLSAEKEVLATWLSAVLLRLL